MASASHHVCTTCRYSLFLVLALTLHVFTAFASKQDAEAAALIEHAKQVSDIHADGAPPFRMKLRFKILKDDGPAMEGEYTEFWVSKAQWREETVVGDFRRIQVTEGDKRWLLDSSTVVPKEVREVPFLYEIGKFQRNRWNSQKDRVLDGIRVHCLEDKPAPSLAGRAICFDKASGTVIAEVRPVQLGSQVGLRTCLRSDYQKFGDRVVARFYECAEGRHPRLEARIVELAAEAARDSALFAPPEGAKEWVNCLGSVTPPKVLAPQVPVLPGSSGSALVMMSIVVGTDGKPLGLSVTSAPNRIYDEAALAAARQWKFQAATCDGKPIEEELTVEIEMHHSHSY